MIGEKLKNIREEKRYSCTLLAEKSGVSRNTIWKIESGVHEPNISTLKALCGVLGVNPAVFFDQSGDLSIHSEGSL